jgi:hypothetical protein
MGKRIKKPLKDETQKDDIDAQMLPEVAVAATPILMIVLTAIFRSVISFFTWKWLEYLFPKKKEEKTDESSNS